MEQKQVSYKVAKAIHKAGYPQTPFEYAYYSNEQQILLDSCPPGRWDKHECSAPTYFDVWAWLWAKKDIHIEIIDSKITKQCYATINGEKDTILFNSPEDAIITAIEYLVDNDLIK